MPTPPPPSPLTSPHSPPQVHLSSPGMAQRKLGMRVAQRVALVVDPTKPLDFQVCLIPIFPICRNPSFLYIDRFFLKPLDFQVYLYLLHPICRMSHTPISRTCHTRFRSHFCHAQVVPFFSHPTRPISHTPCSPYLTPLVSYVTYPIFQGLGRRGRGGGGR